MKISIRKSLTAVLIILIMGLTGCSQLTSLTRHIFSKSDAGENQQELAGSTITVETNSAQAGTVPVETEAAPETMIEEIDDTAAAEETEAQTESETTADDQAAEASGEVTYTDVNETVYTSTDLNARNTPGPDGEVAKTVPAGTKLTRIAIGSDGWDKVDYNGELYYMAHDYLTTQAP